jgi:hypothetical protein
MEIRGRLAPELCSAARGYLYVELILRMSAELESIHDH